MQTKIKVFYTQQLKIIIKDLSFTFTNQSFIGEEM
jgi:hypothetical protein